MEPKPPCVSVLMSVFNAEPFLRQALSSMLVQSFRDFELIVIDDGSTDGTNGLLASMSAEDPRIKVHARANQGLTRSLNLAAMLASGRFLARMDADDVSLPDRLARQVAYLEQHTECLALGGQAIFIDEDGWPVGWWRVPLTHQAIDQHHLDGLGGGIIHPTAMIRREAFEKLGGYDVNLPASQDYDLWLRLAELGKLANLPHCVLHYRLHLASVTSSQRTLQTQCLGQICRRARGRRGLAGVPRQIQRHYPPLGSCRQRLQWVRLALRSGFHRTAKKHALAAWRKAPWRPDPLLHLLAAWIAGAVGRSSPSTSDIPSNLESARADGEGRLPGNAPAKADGKRSAH